MSQRRSEGFPGGLMPALVLGFGVLVLTVLVYWPGMRGGFYFDDLTNIVRVLPLHWNEVSLENIQRMMDLATNATRILSNLSFALNHLAGGLEPAGYHWTNLVIHLLVGVALIWVAMLLAGEQAPRPLERSHVLLMAIAATAFFLLHPLNIQAVTYVVQRMTSLAALFVLLSFGCYLMGRRAAGGTGWFAGSLICWLLGLMSKEIAVMLPFLLLLYEACFHGSDWLRRSRVLAQRFGGGKLVVGLSLLLLALAVGLAYIYYQPGLIRWHEQFAGRDFTGEQRVLTQARVQFFYLSLLFWPAPSRLNLDHEFPLSVTLFQPWTTALAVTGWLVLLAGAIWLARRQPRYGFPLLAYGLFHVLESAPIGLELVFEHRMYLPMCFLVLLLTNLGLDFLPRQGWRTLIPLLLLIPLSGATYARNLTWSDPLTFLRDCAAKSPNKFRPWYNLGTELGQAGQFGEAEQALQNALRAKPGDSQTHNQLGNVYLMLGRRALAFEQYRSAFAVDEGNLEAMFNLAMLYEMRGEYQSARELYRRFLELAPPPLEAGRQRALQSLRRMGGVP